jgi:hypothetical protein
MRTTTRGNYQEATLRHIQCTIGDPSQTLSGSAYRPYNIGLAVGLTHYYAFFKKGPSRLVPMLGLGVMPFVSANESSLEYGGSHIIRTVSTGVTTQVCPRIAFFPSKRVFFDLTSEIELVRATFLAIKYRTGITADDTYNNFSLDGVPGLFQFFNVQAGMGIKL